MRGDLPRGVVTFLFTDIEGSTRLLRQHGAAYADLLARHRDTLRSAFETHAGVEIDSQGDAFLVAFERASDALAAAIDGQRALAAGPVRVRMGIHTGEPTIRDGGYVGLDVHRGARIAAAGHGGQVLLSATTRTLTELPVLDLGAHHLRDMAAPERIFQLLIEGLPTEFPLLRTPEAGRIRLPARTTSFVGREAELVLMDEILARPGCRLVTLVGPGGAGKTSLAVEAAARRAHRYPQGVTLLELAHVPDAGALLPALAEGLGFRVDTAHSGGRTPEDQLIDFLAPRACLLVMDDIGHLSEGAPLLSRILQRAPGVEILATSRSRLKLGGEWLVEVGGLATSEPGRHDRTDPSSRSDASPHSAAMQLFIERARQVAPDFRLDDEGWQAVAGICALVDGMPLGIELAAAWMHILSPVELAAELTRSFDILSTDSPDMPERHRSLRAVFDGSWRLLGEEEQRALARLTVFRGPFSRQAAERVCGTPLSTLAELVTRSLLTRTQEGRFAIHALVREFAGQALAESGEHGLIREAHAGYFAGRLRDEARGPDGRRTTTLRRSLRPEMADLREALGWAVANWPGANVREFLRGVDVIYGMAGEPEAVGLFRGLVERVDHDRRPELDAGAAVPSGVLVRLRLALGLADLALSAEADALAGDCLVHLGASDLRPEKGLCLLALGVSAANRDEAAQARDLLEEAIVILHPEGDEREVVGALLYLGWCQLMLDDVAAARRAFEDAHAIATRTGDPVLTAFSRSKLGLLEDSQGHFEEALRQHLGANDGFEAAGDMAGVGYALSRASMSAYCLDRKADALRHAQAAYDAFGLIGHHWGTTISLCRVAFATLGTGDPERARDQAREALRRASTSSRITALHALTALGAAEAGCGDVMAGERILRLVLAQPELPAIYRVLAERESRSARGGAGVATPAGVDEPASADDLDALVAELLAPRDAGLPA